MTRFVKPISVGHLRALGCKLDNEMQLHLYEKGSDTSTLCGESRERPPMDVGGTYHFCVQCDHEKRRREKRSYYERLAED